jgi:CheY-like chemotaxis protein
MVSTTAGEDAMRDPAAVPSFRALILEDHDFQRRIGAQVLTQCGATQVLQASDGAGALDLIATSEQPIDVLLCDLNMPGMDGLAFLRHIAERGGNSSVILASALDASIIRAAGIMARSYGIRLVGIVEKPLARSKLLPLILRHFSMNRTQPRSPVELMPVAEIASGIDLGEFEPFFQPKVLMRTDALVGVEVLMRWRHPRRGLLPPAAFIPVMEANGLISAATFAVLGAALAQCRRWRKIGWIVPIALNLSVESLSDTGLPDRLEDITGEAGYSPSLVTLEITETVAMTDLGPLSDEGFRSVDRRLRHRIFLDAAPEPPAGERIEDRPGFCNRRGAGARPSRADRDHLDDGPAPQSEVGRGRH